MKSFKEFLTEDKEIETITKELTKAGLKGFDIKKMNNSFSLTNLTGTNHTAKALEVIKSLGYEARYINSYKNDAGQSAGSMQLNKK